MTSSDLFPATRQAGLDRLATFLPRAGTHYASQRNYDYGPQRRSNISCLSPYIRHRLITEPEILRAVIDVHGAQGADKFIQEICWRTYWKGWLESRPAIWTRYRREVAALSAKPHPGLAYATTGRSSFECLDEWVRELYDTGYLHNHARMWFASIWIHSLKLPWQLGADLFERHLIDSDPASNLLSWRWVAGLHTKGKAYLARADNIARYTEGRFMPKGLAELPLDLDEMPPPAPRALPILAKPPQGAACLLITEEDMNPESLDLAGINIAGVATVQVTDSVFAKSALIDAGARASAYFQAPVVALPALAAEHIAAWAHAMGVRRVITAYAPVGPTAERLHDLTSRLMDHDIGLSLVRRTWDESAWPHATKGFFALKAHIPALLEMIAP
jgi:deoxyribodipyrimidine photo-lyase